MVVDIADAVEIEIFIGRDEYRLVLNEYLLERRYRKTCADQQLASK